jgi:hypothetical protein
MRECMTTGLEVMNFCGVLLTFFRTCNVLVSKVDRPIIEHLYDC